MIIADNQDLGRKMGANGAKDIEAEYITAVGVSRPESGTALNA